MYRLIIFFFLLAFYPSIAQEDKMTAERADRITYSLYNFHQWEELVSRGHEFLEQDIDFYYLRLRIGIACFKLQDYRQAITHFHKAIDLSEPDEVLLEYLYYAYTHADRKPDSKRLLQKYKQTFDDIDMGENESVFESFGFSGGGSLNNNDSKNLEINPEDDYNFVRKVLYDDNWYLNFHLSHHFLKRMTLFHAYNYINIERNESFWENDLPVYQIPYYTDQHEYFIQTNVPVHRGFSLNGVYHFINSRFISSDPLLLNRFPNQNPSPGLINYQNQVAHLNGTFDYSDFKFILGGIAAKLNEEQQYETFLTLSYYPFGNLNLYSTSNLILHHNDGNNRFIFDQKIGFRIKDFLWFETNATFGELHNFVEPNSIIVYNIPDIINFKGGINLFFPIDDQISLALYYKYYKKEDVYYTYENPNDYFFEVNVNNHKFDYEIHSLTGGLLWYF